MSDNLKTNRLELVAQYELAHSAVSDAKEVAAKIKADVIAFDAEHPEIARAMQDEAGAVKKAQRGSTGTTVDAEGNAELPAAHGEGG